MFCNYVHILQKKKNGRAMKSRFIFFKLFNPPKTNEHVYCTEKFVLGNYTEISVSKIN
jgi:hypothetical protein